MKLGLLLVLTSNFFQQTIDSIKGNYRETMVLYCYWSLWLISFFSLLYSHIKEKPKLMRILHILIIIRNIMPWMNFEDRKTFDDMAVVVQFSSYQNLGIQLLLGILCFTEKFKFHIPISIVAQLLISYSQICLFIQKSGVQDRFKYVIKNKIDSVLQLALYQFVT